MNNLTTFTAFVLFSCCIPMVVAQEEVNPEAACHGGVKEKLKAEGLVGLVAAFNWYMKSRGFGDTLTVLRLVDPILDAFEQGDLPEIVVCNGKALRNFIEKKVRSNHRDLEFLFEEDEEDKVIIRLKV